MRVRRLVAIVAAALVAACCLVGVSFALPASDAADPSLEYGYVYSGVKSEDIPFTLAASHDDSYFLFGSSELATYPHIVSTAPDNVLMDYDCGYQFMYIGEAYDQDLWMAIAAGAYADDMPNKKVGIIVSATRASTRRSSTRLPAPCPRTPSTTSCSTRWAT